MICNTTTAFATRNKIAWFNATICFVIASLIAGTVLIDDTFDLETADRMLAGITQMTGWAITRGLMIFCIAKRIRSTSGVAAGLCTLIANAG